MGGHRRIRGSYESKTASKRETRNAEVPDTERIIELSGGRGANVEKKQDNHSSRSNQKGAMK